MRFVKMHGIGNDYVYVDAVSEPSIERRGDLPALARRISERHTGVGSDGLILLCRPTERGAHVRMRMWNADGSEAEMCGNGVRCVAKFAHDRLGMRERPLRVETARGVLGIEYEVRGGKLVEATVDMGEPILETRAIPVELPRAGPERIVDFPLNKYIPLDAGEWMEDSDLDLRMTCVSMGNPHLVVFCGRVAGVPLEILGPFLERQPIFPNRINSHFVQVRGRREATMRTWERGAGATRACGTGACAVAVAGVLTERLDREVQLQLPGGDLRVRWDEASNHVFMTGPAEEVFEGEWPE
jgi:diaminopimelate epimerase